MQQIILLAMKLVTLTLALLLGPALAAPNNPERTFMVWMLADANTSSAAWDARAANIKAHSANLTSVSPCIYDISASGTFAPGTGPRPYALLYPHMKEMQAMGLQVIPLIAGPPNTAGQLAGVPPPLATENLLENTDGVLRPPSVFSRDGGLLPSIHADARYIDAVIVSKALTSDNGARFIKGAVAAAVANKWAGYNFDNELRGKLTDESWKFLDGYGRPWMKFLNTFADAMHAVNKTPVENPP